MSRCALAAMLLLGLVAPLSAAEPAPKWIWAGQPGEMQKVYLHKTVKVPLRVLQARVRATCDNSYKLFVNGKQIVGGDNFTQIDFADAGAAFKQGDNLIAVEATNSGGPAGFVAQIDIETPRNTISVVTDTSWTGTDKAAKDWQKVAPADAAKASVQAELGGGSWPKVDAVAFQAAAKLRAPTATHPDQLKVVKDFKVELLYSVPKDQEGSWVNITVDNKGRLIVSDQYGKLYRLTPPTIGSEETLQIEPIELEIGQAQGLLYAFDSLYVMVANEAYEGRGLYRVRDTNGDDKYDEVQLLRKLEGGGEHGPHAILPGPDGKSLYIIVGNQTGLTEINTSRVPRVWGEDQLLPRMWDGNGFMKGVLAPGGWIARTDPDAKEWELVCTGFRNEFDGAFNRYGDLFTYDADMEWDVNAPWYRPTRVCHVLSGGEFGWRSGAGKFPAYYPDNLPAVVNVGPGSPTGTCFGYGAKFPAKYQEAFYLCDWSYGKLYACHLEADGATYKGQLEEFVAGSPLPLTDVIIRPQDGAMYITVGGRKTQSGLYRVTYGGPESTAPAKPDDTVAAARAARVELENQHLNPGPDAQEKAFAALGSEDRSIRFAARVLLEKLPVDQWDSAALGEKNPQAALTALCALARVGSTRHQISMLGSLAQLKWDSLSDAQRLELLRVYGLAFIRLGAPTPEQAAAVAALFDPHYPHVNRELNAELCKLLVYLQSPSATAKTMALLANAPTQEEQIDYLAALRVQKTGWTPELRQEYFKWFIRAANFRGGNSLKGFMKNIRQDALVYLTAEETKLVEPILEEADKTPTQTIPMGPPRAVVQEWTLDDLVPLVQNGLSGRDFDRGRAMFGAAQCFNCHRFATEGGAAGPDLTQAAGRFSARDLLESIVEPSKVISDQYGAVTLELTTGKNVTGRIVNLNGDTLMINVNMLDPNGLVNVDRKQVENIIPSKLSMMPVGLLNTLNKDEILDLMAYLLSKGDRNSAVFKKAAN